MDGKVLGKITKVRYGFDDHLTFGAYFHLEGSGFGVVASVATGPHHQRNGESLQDFQARMGRVSARLVLAMQEAKVQNLHEMEGKPVEVEFEGNMIKDWRILTEVL